MNWYSILKKSEEEMQEPATPNVIDIGSGGAYPADELSNFNPHPFTIDGVAVAGMEGFLQSLKFESPEKQTRVQNETSLKSKYLGKRSKWWKRQTLHWLGKEMDREGAEYQSLLDRAFGAMFDQSETFREALRATGDAALTHSIGKDDPTRTVLTEREFCDRLTQLREKLQ
jgi:predicted NAD-dependent protein-ADP-ribosyltransferase YbiA (DUF1768 family)